MERTTLTYYTLSRKMRVSKNSDQWFDIATDTNEQSIRNQAATIKELEPDAVLGLRKVVEQEIAL